MRTARPLKMTPDGASMVVVTDDKEQFAVPIDDRFTEILSKRPAQGQLETHMESQLRPREIQARLRAGESLEQVATAAGVPAEQIEGFAAPVLAERDYIAGLAQAGPVRRRDEAASARILKQTVADRLLTQGIDIDDVGWDAWKRPDRRWIVQATFPLGKSPHEARFVFDTSGRFSIAENDDARWLIGEKVEAPRSRRRRSNEPDNEPTVDLDDELALVRAIIPAAGPDAFDADDQETASDVEVADYAPAELTEVDGVYDLVPPTGQLDVLYEMLAGIDEDSVRIYRGLQEPGQAMQEQEPEQLALIEYSQTVIQVESRDVIAAEPVTDDEPIEPEAEAVEPAAEATDTPAVPKKRRGKRASVPTWDEIIFGGPTPQ